MIDWAQVDELRADMGDAFDEVVEVFLQEVAEVIDRLEIGDAAAAGPGAGAGSAGRQGLAADLHFLKGAALNLGFSTFADLCAKGERAADSGRAEEIDLQEVRDTYLKSREAFLEGLARRAA